MGTDTCSATLACTAGSCQCANPSHVYKVSLQLCTDKKVFGEACTQVTECHVAAGKCIELLKETRSVTMNIFRKKNLFKSFVKIELSYVCTINMFSTAESCMEQ